MHRQPLLDLLDRYLLRYPAEGDTTLRFRDFVVQNPQCFERSLKEGHVTGSAWILDATGEKTLLTHHRKLNLWLQPGGHADGNSDVLAVAMQECREETGVIALTRVEDTLSFGRILVEKKPLEISAGNKLRLTDHPRRS